MALLRPASLLFFTLMITPSLAAQQSPRRDPQAVAILTQCLDAAGGAQAIASIQDYTGSGTITYYWAGKEVQGSVTLRGRGPGQFRLDASVPAGVRSWTVSRGSGSIKETDGRLTRLPFHNGVNFGSLSFPLLLAFNALNDSSTTISYAGLVTADGHQAHQVRVHRSFPRDPEGLLARLATKDFFIDAISYMVLKTTDMIHPNDRARDDHVHEILLADYRALNRLLVPFSITERVGGQTTWTIQLSSINFNAGLTDADFSLGN